MKDKLKRDRDVITDLTEQLDKRTIQLFEYQDMCRKLIKLCTTSENIDEVYEIVKDSHDMRKHLPMGF